MLGLSALSSLSDDSSLSPAEAELRRVTALLARYKEFAETRLMRRITTLEAELSAQRALCDRMRRDNAILLATCDQQPCAESSGSATLGEIAGLREALARRDAEIRQLRRALSTAGAAQHDNEEILRSEIAETLRREIGEALRREIAETFRDEIAETLRDAAAFAKASADAAKSAAHSDVALRCAAQRCAESAKQTKEKFSADTNLSNIAVELRDGLCATHTAAAALLRDALRALHSAQSASAAVRSAYELRVREMEEEEEEREKEREQEREREKERSGTACDAVAQTVPLLLADARAEPEDFAAAAAALERENAEQAVCIAQLQTQRERFLGAVDAEITAGHTTCAALSGTLSAYLLE